MGDITLYKAGFEIECWHDFCGPCSWREGKRCLLLDTGLKQNGYDDGYGEFPTILRCKSCLSLCSNMLCEYKEI